MSDPRLGEAARRVRAADEVLLHAGPGILPEGAPGFDLAAAVWGSPDGPFTIERFEASPADVWRDWAEHLAGLDLPAEPAPVHECVADLVAAGHVSTVVTETVYGLFREAGVPAEDCIEFHGRVDRARCGYCDRTREVDPGRADRVRQCLACGGPLKPGVVLAGEPPARRDRLRAYARAEGCDAYLAAGTRLTVDPTAENAEHAVETGSDLLVVGERPTPLDDAADYRLHEGAAGALARLRDALLVMG